MNVWGGIFGNVKTPLIRLYGRVTGEIYVRDIIAEKVRPFLRNMVGGMLMHENAPPCRARVMQEFLQCAGFTVMPWLLVSPHLNPIGNVWIAMKSTLRERPVAGSSDDLFT